jgi:hypothetical protein
MIGDQLPPPQFQVATLDGRHVLICPRHKTLATLAMLDYSLKGKAELPYERLELTPMLDGYMMLGFGCLECQHSQRAKEETIKELIWILIPRGEPTGDFIKDTTACYHDMNRESEMGEA